jgi:hypothetical protein
LNLVHISIQRVVNTEIYDQYESVIFEVHLPDYENGLCASSCLAGRSSVCMSVRLCGTTQLPLDGFPLHLNVSNLMKIFWKSVKKNLSFIELW